jgi:hypothetical protein
VLAANRQRRTGVSRTNASASSWSASNSKRRILRGVRLVVEMGIPGIPTVTETIVIGTMVNGRIGVREKVTVIRSCSNEMRENTGSEG